jgi:hypothetical protein
MAAGFAEALSRQKGGSALEAGGGYRHRYGLATSAAESFSGDNFFTAFAAKLACHLYLRMSLVHFGALGSRVPGA